MIGKSERVELDDLQIRALNEVLPEFFPDPIKCNIKCNDVGNYLIIEAGKGSVDTWSIQNGLLKWLRDNHFTLAQTVWFQADETGLELRVILTK